MFKSAVEHVSNMMKTVNYTFRIVCSFKNKNYTLPLSKMLSNLCVIKGATKCGSRMKVM